MTLPNGPHLPPWLQTLRMVAQPIPFLEDCANRYGDTFTLRVMGIQSPPIVFISHPDTVQAVFTHLSESLELGQVTHVFRPLVGDQSLIMQEAGRHRRQRQLLKPALHREQLHRQGALICRLTEQQMTQWRIGQVLCPRSQLSEISLAIILQLVFGLEEGERYWQLRNLLSTLLENITSPLYSTQFFFPPLQRDLGPWSPWGQFLRQRQRIDALIYAEIADRRRQLHGDALADSPVERVDILSMLLQARDEQGETLDDIELRDQLMTLLLLGHETTASALTWALYWLHRHPDCLAQLRQEVDEVSHPAALVNLPYLNAVCREALRVCSVALIAQPRTVRRTIHLEGHRLAVGTVVVPCIYLAHRRSATYDQPDSFRPDRFINRPPSPYEFFPFGGGNRRCIGMALSLLEMKLILATLVSRWDFESRGGGVSPARRGITFVPPRSFRLIPTAPRCPTPSPVSQSC